MNTSELLQLNQATFDAETREDAHWENSLQRILAEDFQIRRSALQRDNQPVHNQTREQMIDWIRADIKHRTPLDEHTWESESLGVVTCAIVIKGADGKDHRYQNIKVFERRKDGAKDPHGDWQCVYWQVTEAPLEAPPQVENA